jgi:dynein heavy chain 1
LYNKISKRHAKWQEKLTLFQTGEKVLAQNRISFSEGWIYYDRIEGEWNAFQQIVARRNEAVQGQRDELITSLRKQDRDLDTKMKEFPEEWKKNKPLNGNIKPEEALSSLSNMQSKLKKLTEDAQR